MSDFDPTYGYKLTDLLKIVPPQKPEGFDAFWQARYHRAMQIDPHQHLNINSSAHPDYDCYDLTYLSTDHFEIGGWALIPKQLPVKRGVVVGHGYGGRDAPEFSIPVKEAVFLFPCFRGLSRSRCAAISDNPSCHVLHNIEQRDHYVLGGCVDDLWLAVTVLLNLFPMASGHIAYLGISFGGGIGALALPWDVRIQRAHFNVPSFGNHPLRLQLPTWGSAAAVQDYAREHKDVLEILSYYDAAVSAQNIQVPVHIAAALADPCVAPPGQFSIYNALPGEKALFLLDQGHAEYPGKAEQEKALHLDLEEFFSNL